MKKEFQNLAKNKLPMRGNILSIIAMSFYLILLVTSSPAFSSTMKGSITINNPEEKFFLIAVYI